MELFNDITPEIETKVHTLSLREFSKYKRVLYSSENKLECTRNITLVLNECLAAIYYTHDDDLKSKLAENNKK